MKSLVITTTVLCYASALVLSNSQTLSSLAFYQTAYEVFFLWIHISAGLLWSAVVFIFFVEHIKDKQKFFKTANRQVITGGLQFLVVLLLILSGVILLIYTISPSEYWLRIHYATSLIIIISSILHIGFKRLFRHLKNKKLH